MAGISVTLKGFERLGEIADVSEVQALLGRALRSGGLLIEGDAKRFAPVDTGVLRASINSDVVTGGGGGTLFVGTNVEYAVYQEYGTSRMSAQPFLVPAFEKHRARIVQEIGEALEEALDG